MLEPRAPDGFVWFAQCSLSVLLTAVIRSTELVRAGGAASWRAARSTRFRDLIPRRRLERFAVIATRTEGSRSTDARFRSASSTAGRAGISFEPEDGRTRSTSTPNRRKRPRSADDGRCLTPERRVGSRAREPELLRSFTVSSRPAYLVVMSAAKTLAMSGAWTRSGGSYL